MKGLDQNPDKINCSDKLTSGIKDKFFSEPDYSEIISTGEFSNDEISPEEFSALKKELYETKLQLREEISLRKTTEENLNNNLSKLLSIIDNSTESILVHVNGKIVFVNERLSKISGYSKEEILNADILDFVDVKYRSLINEKMQELNNDFFQSYEIELFTRFRKSIYAMIKSAPIVFENQNARLVTITDITERKRFEETLKKGEEKYRLIFENSLEGIFQSESSGKILMVNKAFAKILGFENPHDVIQKIQFVNNIFFEKGQWEIIQNYFSRTEKISDLEIQIIKQKGETCWVNSNIRKVNCENGSYHFEGMISDITDRKYVEQIMLESESRFRALIENVSDLVTLMEPDGRVRFESPSVSRLLGLEMIGKNFRDFVLSDDAAKFDSAISKILIKSGLTETVELRFSNSDKKVRVFECVLQNLLSDTFIEGIVINSRDITERKLLEEQLELRVSERTAELLKSNIALKNEIFERKKVEEEIRKFSQAVIQSQNAVGILDVNFRYEYVNPKFTEISGYSAEEVLGKTPSIIEKNRRNLNEIIEAIKICNEWKVEYIAKRKDGSDYWKATSISSIKNIKGEITHFIIMSNDITERVKFEHELIKAKDEAEKADNLKTEFLAQVSHEIRQPVNVILNYGSLIKYELDILHRNDISDLFGSIEKASNRLVRSIDLIVTMSQIQTENFNPNFKIIPLETFVQKISSEFERSIYEKGLNYVYKNSNQNLKIKADEYTLSQIFSNLIDNAVKYTLAGNVEIEICEDEEFAYVEIKDTGIGISQSFLQRIFTPFVQEETGYTRKYEGNGLGLALVKKCMEINNGEISVTSEKGKGSTFTLKFAKIN